ncbi:uncharacterized protein LOC114812293 isoform X2 [Ornithorhynchus anatinus]|uniref:uncharacterized protein LOC114812293 isoform X2 n=1 Tax=Ornithorhynchus anatinus TaxID=9258 RepID=UPI0010A8031A|nr:uncharacterized protein LOC114812293 isoform X2 [Ornithorhynchus anatinus]
MESFSSAQDNLDSSIGLLSWCRSWEGRRLLLRAVALCLSGVSWVLLLPIGPNRLAYIQGPGSGDPSGYLGYWMDCRQFPCLDPKRVTVNRHLGLGFMFLGLVLTSILVPCLGLSFRRIFHRLTHCDLVLGIISCISAAFVLLSMTLFTLECETLHPDGRWPLIDYTLRYYLGWLAGMLLGAAAGTCLTNHLQSQTCHCWGQERSSSQSLEEHQPSSKDDSQDWGKEILLGPVSDPSLSKVSSSSSTSSANLNTAVAKSSISLDLQASRPTPRPSGPPPSGSAPGGRIRPLHCPLGR